MLADLKGYLVCWVFTVPFDKHHQLNLPRKAVILKERR